MGMTSAIVYYSYTGNTRKVALQLKDYLERKGSVELIEIKALDESKSFFGQCNRAFFGKEAIIEGVRLELSGFDLICVGTPVWAFGPAPAINAYLNKCAGVKNKTVVVFTTYGSGTGNGKCIRKIENSLKKKGAIKFRSFSIQQFKTSNKDFILDVLNKTL
ncbi:flavodoxin family protein [Candidatus Omnitrophota bacterium]